MSKVKINLWKSLKLYCGILREKGNEMQVIITIPDEFITDWNKDRFDDALHRLSADAHLIAGNYEQETAKMLAEAFKNAAQQEIVRCKDCKFWRTYTYINGKSKFLPKCGFNQIYVNGEDFCSRAERRKK